MNFIFVKFICLGDNKVSKKVKTLKMESIENSLFDTHDISLDFHRSKSNHEIRSDNAMKMRYFSILYTVHRCVLNDLRALKHTKLVITS